MVSSLAPPGKKHKVSVIGSGNWGSTISKIVGENVTAQPNLFEPEVQMWVYEETVNMSELKTKSKRYDESSELCTTPQPLTKLINHYHENVKYLPDIALPHNVVANPSLTDAVKGSTILIFNLPHQFIERICGQLKGNILPFARGISCIKGVNVHGSHISLFSESIGEQLGIYCGALSGANIASEIAQEKWSETTIAYDPPTADSQAPTPVNQSPASSPSASQVDLSQLHHIDASGNKSKVKLRPIPSEYQPINQQTIKALFHRPYFHVRVVSDIAGVSLSGALKNIVALAAGFVDALGWGDNAKAAVMRVGLLEMVEFGKMFYGKTINVATFTEESAGVADLITTCSGGRNFRCAKMSVQERKPIEEIEQRELNGQKLQGTTTAEEVHVFLSSQGIEKEYPLFAAVYNILQGKAKPEDLPSLIEPSSENLPVPESDSGRSEGEREEREEPLHPSTSEHAADAPVTPPPPDSIASSAIRIEPIPPILPTQVSRSPGTTAVPSKRKTLHPSIIPAHPLSTSRYTRQLLLPQVSLPGHLRLSEARVLVLGLGGLGCPAALYLAAAGIGKLGLLDSDTVELSNLHRQVLHREDSVGWTKVQSAIRGLKEVNSEIEYSGYEEPFTPENAVRIARDYDLILDCTDNPQTRYLVSDVAVALGKTVVSAAAQRMEGQCMILNHPVGQGPCYRCIFPRAPKAEMVVSCEEVGVLGTAVGTMGVIMAGEAIRVLAQDHKGTDRKPSMLLYNAWSETMFRTVRLRGKRKDCISCGEVGELKDGEEKITADNIENGRVDYVTFCGTREDVHVLKKEERISASQFLSQQSSSIPASTGAAAAAAAAEPNKPSTSSTTTTTSHDADDANTLIIDVREPHEYVLGPQIKSSINIPISRILRATPSQPLLLPLLQERSPNQNQSLESSVPPPKFLIFLCKKGNDSQIAARKFMDEVHSSFSSSDDDDNSYEFIGDVEGGIEALIREGS